MLIDLNSVLKMYPSTDPAAIIAGNATKTGATIDRQGYESLEFLAIAGVITDSTLTCTVYESNASDMTGETAVADADLIGQTNGFVHNAASSSTIKKVGYKGTKRYVRLKIVQTSATTGGFVCAVAIQGNAKFNPLT